MMAKERNDTFPKTRGAERVTTQPTSDWDKILQVGQGI